MTSEPRGLELLQPSCNLDTIRDGRGGIVTWVPDDAILEFNLVYLNPGMVRGRHHHPEFDEYLLVVAGEGMMVWRPPGGGADQHVFMSKGMCSRAPAGVVHAFHAVSHCTCVAMITKPWDECGVPYVRAEEPPSS